MADMRSSFSVIQGVILLTQVGFGVATPLLLCIFGANYLTGRFAIGSWLMIVAILFGVAAGIYNAYLILNHAFKQLRRDKEE